MTTMKKKYIIPTAFVVKVETEGLLALSTGDKVEMDNGAASNGNFTNKKNPIWGDEPSNGPWK